jgi:type II secretory pathway pseudopilin PulG
VNQRGYTLFELLIVLGMACTAAISVFFLILIAQALLKYINS